MSQNLRYPHVQKQSRLVTPVQFGDGNILLKLDGFENVCPFAKITAHVCELRHLTPLVHLLLWENLRTVSPSLSLSAALPLLPLPLPFFFVSPWPLLCM